MTIYLFLLGLLEKSDAMGLVRALLLTELEELKFAEWALLLLSSEIRESFLAFMHS